MTAFIKYKVVEASTSRSLEDDVNNLLEEGWVPVGGVSFMRQGAYSNYAQSLALPKSLDPVVPERD